jgi:hypothetical protein
MELKNQTTILTRILVPVIPPILAINLLPPDLTLVGAPVLPLLSHLIE